MRPVLALCVSVLMLALCNATAARSPLSEVQKGTITIQHQTRVDDSLKMTLAALGQPLAVDSPSTAAAAAGAGPMASVAPAVTANMKRIYFKNNCTCQGGVQSSKAPYPVVALSYKPVQSADFYNIGFWSVTGCDAKYLVATTEGVMGIYAELSDGSWVWDGTKSLTVYVPSQNKCVGRKKFVQYDLPLDWQDHTVYLNC